MAVLLDLPVRTLSAILTDTKKKLTDAYSSIETAAGKVLDAFFNDNLLFQRSEFYARIIQFLEALARENASQATPMGATGQPLDLWLDLKDVSVPTATTAKHTIDVTGTNNATLPAGTFCAAVSGERHSTDSVVNFGPDPSTISVDITAEGAGSNFNLKLGDDVFLENPGANITVNAPVSVILVVGADPANDDQKSGLLRASFGGDAGAGTAGYYVAQTKQLDGAIGQVFIIEAGFGVGSVVIYPLLTLTQAQQDSEPWLVLPPSQGQVDGWETTLRDPEIRIVNHRIFVEVVATPEIDIDMTITPDTADTQAAALKALNLRFQESYATDGYTIANSEMVGAVSNAEGILSVIFGNVTAGTGADSDNVPNPGPSADVFALNGQLLLIGVLSF